MLTPKIMQTAARYASFSMFRAHERELYAKLLKRPADLKALHAMFEDGRIELHREAKVDRRRKEHRVTPNIKRAGVYKGAKLYLNFQKFMRNGGPFAAAAKRLGMEEELRMFFERVLHPDEVFEEAEQFNSWDDFEENRPRYAAYAEETKMKDAVVRHIAKAVYENGGKKK